MPTDCPFCQRIQDGDYLPTGYHGVVTFEPLNPVTPGHRLFVSRTHVTDALIAPAITADVFDAAARYGSSYGRGLPVNLITSVGHAATQTVMHFHVHYVPRHDGDGLHLPWTGQ